MKYPFTIRLKSPILTIAKWVLTISVLQGIFFNSALTLAEELNASQVQLAIDGGITFLRSQQLDNGSWGDYSSYRGGKTALCALAALSCGVPQDDPDVSRAVQFLRSIPPTHTYVVALQTMVFCAASPQRDIELIRRNVRWLEATQIKTPPRPGTWTYTQTLGGQGDNSNTQFALLALHEAARVGVKVSPEVWRLARDHWAYSQSPNGGWKYYLEPALPETGSMTCAGIASMIILSERLSPQDAAIENGEITCCRQGEGNDDQRRIQAAIQWLAQHFSASRNPGSNRFLYYLYALERTGRMSGSRFIGQHDWYREGADLLVRLKGSRYNQTQFVEYWYGEEAEERDPVIATCYALLFLSKGRRAVLISKLEYGLEANWNIHRNDIKNLTAFVEQRWHKEMTWQNIDLNAATSDDLLISPLVFLSGTNSPVPSNEAQARKLAQKLRDYVDRGGFIVAESVCGGAAFESGFKQLISLMFPGESGLLQPLPPEHPIWRAEVPISPSQLRPIYGISFGCRTSIVFLPSQPGAPSLSCLWEASTVQNTDTPLSEKIKDQLEGGLNLGLNIASYATNRQIKTKDEILASQTGENNSDRMVRGRLYVANVRHPGGCQSAPRALQNLLETAAKQLGLRTGIQERQVALSDSHLYEYPVLFMHGRTSFNLTPEERERLKTYLERGGTLFVNSICASDAFNNSFRQQIKLMYPDNPLRAIPGGAPVWSSQFGGFDLSKVEIRRPIKEAGKKAASAANSPVESRMTNSREPVQMEGLLVNGRYAIFYSPLDISCALERYNGTTCTGYSVEDAARIGLNVLLYAVQK